MKVIIAILSVAAMLVFALSGCGSDSVDDSQNTDTAALSDYNESQTQYITTEHESVEYETITVKGKQIPVNSTHVDLSGTGLVCADLQPLTRLTNLQSLVLDDNDIVDITIIGELKQLTLFSAMDNEIEDISPLSGLYKLQFIDLDYNNIDNISVLANLHDLQRLFIRGNNVSDLSPLNNSTRLEVLDVRNNGLSIDCLAPLGYLALNMRILRY
jgi:Leucine-rich repeat (LRR) protein